MTLRAIMWALKDVHLDDPIAKLILIGLADHAHDDGTASWPSRETLAEYAGVDWRTVTRKLQKLQAMGLIRPGDEELVAHIRADRRPKIWDLNVGSRGVIESPRNGELSTDEMSQSHPVGGHGVSESPPRGGTVTPKPKEEPKEPTGRDAPAPVDNSQTLIAEWIDHCPSRPPGRVIGQVAKEVDVMLREGIPYAEVRRGLQHWQSKGLHPSALASAVHEMRTANTRLINGMPAPKPVRERIVCKICQREEAVCRKAAKQTGDTHEWQPQTIRA